MYQMPSEPDVEKLAQICAFINDMLAGECDIIATPGDRIVAWRRTFIDPRTDRQTSAPVDQAEAYYRMTRAGYQPKPLIEAAIIAVAGRKGN